MSTEGLIITHPEPVWHVALDDSAADWRSLLHDVRFADDALAAAEAAGVFGATGPDVQPDTGNCHSAHQLFDLRAALRTDQIQALLDVERHLVQHLEGREPLQLLMSVQGPSGSGKSLLLRHMKELFTRHDCADIVAVVACTMSAAGGVDGQFLHSWAALNSTRRAVLAQNSVRDTRLAAATYILIDQCSSLSKSDLALFESCITGAKERKQRGNPALPFAGTNMIIFGDMHQLRPIHCPIDTLFSPVCPRPGSVEGRLLFGQFTIRATLRVDLQGQWAFFLDRLRAGVCTESDCMILRGRILGKPVDPPVDLTSPPWMEAPLLAIRRRVIDRWNSAAITMRRGLNKNQHYICSAVDTVNGLRPADDDYSRIEQITFRGAPRLPPRIEIAVGLRVFVLSGASKALATITNILFDPREDADAMANGGNVHALQYLPMGVVCVKDGGQTVTVVPSAIRFTCANADGVRMGVHRKQIELKPAYAMSLEDAVGLTFTNIFLDLATPPASVITYFQLYSALSKVKQRESLLLVRGIGVDLSDARPPAALIAHDYALYSANV